MQQKSIYFTLGIHCHQPVGNFDYVFEDAYQKSYLPLLECFERHPDIKITFHYSGPLWDWLLENKPDWLEKINALIKRGQLEMMTGAYYEPLLINISDRDKIGQIKMMNRLIRRKTNQRPRGIWCAERVWEPALPRPISLADIKYTVLDESHFRYAGLFEKDMFGYYVTEEQGHPLCVFPISYNLRQMIPFDEPGVIIDYLKKWADESGNKIAVFADDAEKFGLWPKSYESVWEEEWMERFLCALEENSSWLKTITFSQYMKKYPPAGRVYLPTATYFEMSTWALPVETGRRFRDLLTRVRQEGRWEEFRNFLRGGFWRYYLSKYPESNRIQKKALYVSEKVHRMVTRDKSEAEIELYKGQCNCPYWHGMFGGIYLPHLRHAVQQCLIRAEKIADEEFHHGEPYQEIQQLDINLDLRQEVIINTTGLQLSFYPHLGGTLYEMDYKKKAINVCDTLTRREEIYHDQMADPDKQVMEGERGVPAAEELKKYLVFDKYQRLSFIDHFLEDGVDPESLWSGDFVQLGDFVEAEYEVFTSTKDDKSILTLSRKGAVTVDGEEVPVEIEKTFFVPREGGKIDVQYWVINNSDHDLDLNFGCELDFSFLSHESDTNHVIVHRETEVDGEPYRLTERLALTEKSWQMNPERIILQDNHRQYQIALHTGQKARVCLFPIETVSHSEEGFEKVYQSTVVIPIWKVRLEAGDSWDNTLTLEIGDIPEEENEQTEEVEVEEMEEVG